MNNIKVSIIVPVYNVEKYIHRCIASILSQTFCDFECILVDDCTPDNSGNICNEYSAYDSRIKVIHKLHNEGLPQARKTGFEHSSGDYIQFVDSDDWIEPDMIEKLYQKATSENLDITICDYFVEKEKLIKIVTYRYFDFDKIGLIKKYFKNEINTYVWNKFIKRELLLLVDFPLYNFCEDFVITIQNIYNSHKIGSINIPLYHYRYNNQSLLNNRERLVAGRIEENKNINMVLKFLESKYKNLKLFEPEISIRANKLKHIYISNRHLRKNKELFIFYPKSGFLTWLLTFYLKNALKMIMPLGLFLLYRKKVKKDLFIEIDFSKDFYKMNIIR